MTGSRTRLHSEDARFIRSMLKNLSSQIANVMQRTMSALDFAPGDGRLEVTEKKLGIRINGNDSLGLYIQRDIDSRNQSSTIAPMSHSRAFVRFQ